MKKIEDEKRAFLYEKNVIETEAQMVIYEQLKKGKLVLTNHRLIFINEDGEVVKYFMLNNIDYLSISKVLGFMSNGFRLCYNDSLYKVRVKYPDDWIKLILLQKQSD
ncbi:hypothetical protein KEM09_05085 [Carboxylicivirga mesophila]|uniref:GRAM domain-containing protein n=1 Tax=Carboxylicivirga mesophila TaxID=1166478 RepID=A0ABS5K723_9BACT|nr:hypothetical protein [Carboxylicivirga mesophila]MBS2210760.1 hypothetical protein [Carboxylicivirga mesophila]